MKLGQQHIKKKSHLIFNKRNAEAKLFHQNQRSWSVIYYPRKRLYKKKKGLTYPNLQAQVFWLLGIIWILLNGEIKQILTQ